MFKRDGVFGDFHSVIISLVFCTGLLSSIAPVKLVKEIEERGNSRKKYWRIAHSPILHKRSETPTRAAEG